MIIVGAKGLAKELLEILAQRQQLDNLYFFDNVSADIPEKLFDRFPVIQSIDDVREIFDRTGDRTFTLGLGKPVLRYKLSREFQAAGGILTSAISPKADIGQFGTAIGEGCTILSGVVITNGVTIGEGCLLNPHCSVSHDTRVGRYVELSPGVRLTGNCSIGDMSNLGTNAVVLPGIKVGKNVIAGAGAVIIRDVPDNSMVVGVPAVITKKLDPLNF